MKWAIVKDGAVPIITLHEGKGVWINPDIKTIEELKERIDMALKIPLISGDEQDALTPARHWYNWRPGIRKAIKRAYNKRFRRAAKISLDNPE